MHQICLRNSLERLLLTLLNGYQLSLKKEPIPQNPDNLLSEIQDLMHYSN